MAVEVIVVLTSMKGFLDFEAYSVVASFHYVDRCGWVCVGVLFCVVFTKGRGWVVVHCLSKVLEYSVQ